MEEPIKTGLEIAVIGMAGRFPGADNIDEFRDNLKNGIETICFFSTRELEEAGVSPGLAGNPNYIKASGIIEDIDCFDASFFGYTPKEAEIMDPQVRVFHECVWTALENAGYDVLAYDGLIGLYAGASPNMEWEARTFLSGKNKEIGYFEAGQLIQKDFLSLRVSYKLNLMGPSFGLYTACSTSLAAIHIACQAILNGECDMAAAGGITLAHLDKKGYIFQEGMIASPDGHCRAFDARAKGTIGGDGVGVVVLKRLEEAILERDYIYAVIKGSVMNNDGIRKVGFTAPSAAGQGEVIKMALQMAEIEPETISYIEAHGTGTGLGDPVEIHGLKRAFQTNKKRFCALGSVKTNFGHLDSAAGAAGFIKTVLALKYRFIPPSLHFETPNPDIDFENSPFYVNTELKEWTRDKYPLRAGVSSFGIGGTNVHVVLEEAPQISGSVGQWVSESVRKAPEGTGGLAPLSNRQYQLILLSAKTAIALDKMTGSLTNYFKGNPHTSLTDAAYTLQIGRRPFEYRRMAVCSTLEDAIAALSARDTGKTQSSHANINGHRPVVFMFPGLGAQYENMGLELYQTEPVFQQEMDRCFEILKPLVDVDIKEILYPQHTPVASRPPLSRGEFPGGSVPCNSPLERGAPQGRGVSQPEIAQLLVFIFEYALAKLLIKWGITPRAMIGYSFGEYVAACISGVFSLEGALKLVVTRGQLVNRLPRGGMLSVPIAREQLEPLLPPGLSISIDNGPSCVVSGPQESVYEFEKQMKEKKYLCMRLEASCAFHSPMMEPILGEFKRELLKVSLNQPQIPYISNVTGKWITSGEAADPAYWVRHLRETVRFAGGIKELAKQRDYDNAVWVEVGPGRDLSALVMRFIENNPGQTVISLQPPPGKTVSEAAFLLNRIGRLWLWGVDIHWQQFYQDEKLHRIPLPAYPFEKHRYWIDTDPFKIDVQKPGTTSWCYVPLWKPSLLNPQKQENTRIKRRWLVFVNRHPLVELLVKQLKKLHQEVITVKEGDTFKQIKEDGSPLICTYVINPRESDHYDRLFRQLPSGEQFPHQVLHCWTVTPASPIGLNVQSFNALQYKGFFSLLYIARASGKRNFSDMRLTFLSTHLHSVMAGERLCPGKAPVLGLLRVTPQEYPGIRCRSIDIRGPEPGGTEEEELISALVKEFFTDTSEPDIAYRGSQRWVRFFEPLHLETPQKQQLGLKNRGVYLITGGTGTIGLIFAQLFVKHVRAKVILTGRSPFPASHEWGQWLDNHRDTDPVSLKIKKLRELEAIGGEILYLRADAANLEQMSSAVAQSEECFGKINGVIHAAGIIENQSIRTIRELTDKDCQQQFQAKVYGTMVLEKLFASKELDFCWLISSISCVLGGLGLGAYASANWFLDAFVKKHNQSKKKSCQWFSLDWDGMDADKSTAFFEQFLSLEKIDQLVVSRGGDLNTRIDQWVKLETTKTRQKEHKEHKYSDHPRPDLTGDYVAPHHHEEQVIVQIWQELLGIDKIGIRDDFLELGGDSLKAITVISRIHQQLNVQIPIARFFKYPTIEKIAGYVINSKNKTTFAPIEPAEKQEYYRLSSAQKRLYFLHWWGKDNLSYNVPQVMELAGILEKERLEHTFKMLIQRHESLRTSFIEVAEEPVQRIHREVEFEIEYYQVEVKVEESEGTRGLAPLSGPAARGSQPAAALISSFIRPFDLSKAPLLRVGLIHTHPGPSDHPSQEGNTVDKIILMVDMHHIISDLVSSDIFVKDFFYLYEAQQLAPLPLQYKDFSQWQNAGKNREDIKKQETFWIQQLEGDIPVLNLPTDYQRPAVQSFAGAKIDFKLTPGQTTQLKELARQHQSTLFIVLLALYHILLSKLSSQEDIIIGTPVVGRRHADLDRIMGIFINVLPLRGFLPGQNTFNAFLDTVREKTLAAFDNQDYPFEDLVEKKVVNRDMSRNPLFSVLFSFQDTFTTPDQPQEKETKNLEIKPYDYESQSSQFDLSLVVLGTEPGLHFSLVYCTKLFKQGTITRFINYFKNIISGVPRDPAVKIWGIETMSPDEKKQLLVDFNETETAFPLSGTLDRMFEEQALRNPDNIAAAGALEMKYKSYMTYMTHISYRELNERSHRLTQVLIEKGVRPDTIVAIMTERSVEMVIGLLGILKAGGAYLPIDPGYPAHRVDFMLKDTGAKLLLINVEQEIPGYIPNTIEMIDLKDEIIHDSDNRNPHELNRGPGLAYVIYTSGSTGKPKGVLLEHRNLINLIRYQHNCTNIDFSRVLQFAAISFDMSFNEIFSTLLAGGMLYLLDRETRKNIPGLFKFIERNEIKTLFFPTSFLKFISNEPGYIKMLPGKVNHIVPGGEQLLVVNRFKGYLLENNVYLHNQYGPSETHVVTSLTLDPAGDIPQLPSIGKPVANTRIYIVNKGMHLVPLGVPGELVIGGMQVGRGYLNNPELTAQKFCLRRPGALFEKTAPGPRKNFSLGGSHRSYRSYKSYVFYKTGDLARWLPDGNIEFLGRIDRQVKVRGFRIEPGEIETRLMNHNEIKEAVVIFKEKKYLCAYIVASREFNVSELRKYLSKNLPDYMLPSYFVQVEKIPLTPNGKIDMEALPQPQLKPGAEYKAPGNTVQEKLAELWSEVLAIEKDIIGINSNFFELGGNSFQLMKLVSKIYHEFGTEIIINQVFQEPTIVGIEKVLKSGQAMEEPVVLLNEPASRSVFCFPSSVGFGFNYTKFASFIPGYSFYAFHFIEEADRLSRYIQHITKFQPEGPYLLFGWSAAGRLIFQVAHELELKGFQVSDIILADSFFIPEEEDERTGKGKELYFGEIEYYLEKEGLEFLKEKVLRKTNSYLDYLDTVTQLEVVEANVHLILSTEKREGEESDLPRCWNPYTKKTTYIYQGYGGHRDMFAEEYAAKNAEVFKDVLNKIEKCNKMSKIF